MPLPPPTMRAIWRAELFLSGLAADLRLFERPVLDAEGFAGRKRDVVVVHSEEVGRDAGGGLRNSIAGLAVAKSARALHDADGIRVELAGDTGLSLILAEREHADAGDQNDGWAGVALLGRFGQRVLRVVLGVLGAIGLERGVDERGEFGGLVGWVPVDEQRADLGADEVVRAAGAEVCELLSLGGVNELENLRRVSVACR